MPMDASASLMHRRYRMYTTRLSETDTDLYPIAEEESPRRKWPFYALVTCSFALVVFLCVSAASYSQEEHSHGYKLPTFDKRNRFTQQKRTLENNCSDGLYSKRTLQRAYELPFSALFPNPKGQNKFEASSVIVVDDFSYAVCDSSWAISKFGRSLTPFSPHNVQIGDPNREPEDSGYEALFYEQGRFYVVRESVDLTEGKRTSFRAIIQELKMGDDDYEVLDTCPTEFKFEGESKGFEGAIAIRDLQNELVVLGLCEGNYCSEQYKSDTGHGRVVAMKKHQHDDGTCVWKTLKQIHIPPSANFRDYSAMSMDQNGRVAIASQEESQLWVSYLNGQNEQGLWDLDVIAFEEKDARVYDFPKNDKCETVYCNIEGIHWIDENMLMAVSDKMKSHGRQDFKCFEKDQSVHAFVLP
eukprot:CAMPEP_0202492634 /NCGR_PEP_ID=MMETSP1361-20130828/9270_1 /ASSEMBLY_ACC=CAM_ASM_000849 /TAXON_ID=210615 /ORGANISM="Staurosira complex sp., Strain CCMP2646" /LENGTH=412 /DNA_ID=CAMNT_0049122861 /DNA_START=13 /DNA_END=1251 /DNA_ORIENTATION=+